MFTRPLGGGRLHLLLQLRCNLHAHLLLDVDHVRLNEHLEDVVLKDDLVALVDFNDCLHFVIVAPELDIDVWDLGIITFEVKRV